MTTLSFRSSTREFAPTPLSITTLGELLWAADRINRPVSGGRTAPSPHAYNEVDIYVALPYGVYRYDALSHQLLFSAVTAGAIAQNVALYCASAGLVNVVRGWIDHRLLADALRLNEDELPILAPTVGLPIRQHT
jgi:hypothetical protein